jgi:hypothetical protein
LSPVFTCTQKHFAAPVILQQGSDSPTRDASEISSEQAVVRESTNLGITASYTKNGLATETVTTPLHSQSAQTLNHAAPPFNQSDDSEDIFEQLRLSEPTETKKAASSTVARNNNHHASTVVDTNNMSMSPEQFQRITTMEEHEPPVSDSDDSEDVFEQLLCLSELYPAAAAATDHC